MKNEPKDTSGPPTPAEPSRAPAGDQPSEPPRRAAPTGDSRQRDERRKFLRSAALGVGVVGLSLAGALPVLAGHRKRLRPPGALDEADFLASCIKCGQCVQVCPVEAIDTGSLVDGFGVGVPFIAPREQACDFACDVGQCILACPTGALVYQRPASLPSRPGAQVPAPPLLVARANPSDPPLQFTERMGVARLVRPEACLSILGRGVKGPARGARFRGKRRYVDVNRWEPTLVVDHPYELERCDLCARECPVEGAIAIVAVTRADGVVAHTPRVLEACVGCGVCEMMCPAEPAAIVVEPRQTWEAA